MKFVVSRLENIIKSIPQPMYAYVIKVTPEKAKKFIDFALNVILDIQADDVNYIRSISDSLGIGIAYTKVKSISITDGTYALTKVGDEYILMYFSTKLEAIVNAKENIENIGRTIKS